MNQVLFPNMVDTFVGNGHEFVSKIEDCDCVLMDLHSRINNYRQSDVDWMISHRIPFAVFDEWDRGGMSLDIYPLPLTGQQKQIFDLIGNDGIKDIHFCRLLGKVQHHSYNIYPYEKPISYCEPVLTPDELFNREYDVVFIANQSPSRDRIAEALRNDGRLNCFISIGDEKRPFEEFLRIHKLGKLFVSSGAGGMTDERKQLLFSVAGLIQENHDQLLLHPFTHMDNCLMINNPPTQEDLNTIFEVVNDKEKLYGIYQRNYEFMKKYYSKEYIANNILETILNNL